jgi:hypothetical protein
VIVFAFFFGEAIGSRVASVIARMRRNHQRVWSREQLDSDSARPKMAGRGSATAISADPMDEGRYVVGSAGSVAVVVATADPTLLSWKLATDATTARGNQENEPIFSRFNKYKHRYHCGSYL